MNRSLQQPLPPMEVKSLHQEPTASEAAVKELHRVPMRMAKAEVGAVFTEAFGDQARKAFGHEGLVSGVCSGAKVPDYLAKIYADPEARVRFGVAWLKGARRVRVRKRIELEIEEG